MADGRDDRRADRAVGGRWRRGGPVPAGGQPCPGGRGGATLGRGVPGCLLSGGAARRHARGRELHAGHGAAGGGTGPAAGGHAPHPVPARGGFSGARGAGVHCRRRGAGRSEAGAALPADAVFPHARGDDGAVRRPAGGAGQLGRDRATLCGDAAAGQPAAAHLPDAGRGVDRGVSGSPGRGRAGKAAGEALSRSGGAGAEDARVRGAAQARVRDHHQDGIPGLLPHRGGLHCLGQAERGAGGAGAGFGCGLAGGVLAGHHRSGPAAVCAAVRTLPEPGTGVDARLRHRLLPGQPGQGDRVRAPQVRLRRSVADRDLRHDGQQGGDPRCGPGAGHALQLLRPALQADPDRAGQAAVAGQGAQGRAAAGRAAGQRGGGGGAVRAGAAAGGHDPQHRHARRWRADCAGQAHGLLSALPGAGHRFGGQPVRQGRRGGGGPGEVRLPGPAKPHHHRPSGALRERAARARGAGAGGPGQPGLRRPGGLSDPA